MLQAEGLFHKCFVLSHLGSHPARMNTGRCHGDNVKKQSEKIFMRKGETRATS